MIRRTTWVMVVTFIIVLAAAWLWQRSKDEQEATQPTPTSQPVLLNLNLDDIRKLDIEDSQGRKLILGKNADGSWEIQEPEIQDADTEKVNSSLSQLASVPILNTLVEPPAQEQIGLASPAYTLKIDTRDGRRHTVYIGDETPTQSGYYVRFNDQIYVVSKFAINGLIQMLENPPLAATPTSTLATQKSDEVDVTPVVTPMVSTTGTPVTIPSPLTVTATTSVSATPGSSGP